MMYVRLARYIITNQSMNQSLSDVATYVRSFFQPANIIPKKKNTTHLHKLAI